VSINNSSTLTLRCDISFGDMEGSWRDRPALKGTETPSGSTGTSQTQYSLREEDMSRAQKALEEGRRIYVGNLPYEALSGDLERLFSSDQYTM
jgi:RNA recognition motif-containing protein